MAKSASWVVSLEDCEARLIPSGMVFTIPSGTQLEITQAKGSAITVQVNGQLARIEGKDIEALNLSPEQLEQWTPRTERRESTTEATGPVDIEAVWQKLSTCYDPEIPVNVVDLGLIYECTIEEQLAEKKNTVCIKMTLTAPGCGMGPVIMQDVEQAVLDVPNVTAVSVELVFEPTWTQEMISEAARLELGLL